MKLDGLIFDLDGTLWDATDGIKETWKIVLSHHPDVHKEVTASDLATNFGKPIHDIADNLFPMLEPAYRYQLMDECCNLENSYLSAHGGNLYPDEQVVLAALAAHFPLFIVSNCQDGYIQSYLKGNRMEKYFSDFESIGVTGLSKGENIKLIIQRNHLQNTAYVGDTIRDAEGAAVAGIPFIHAAYGFGEVKACAMKLHTFRDLLDLIGT